MTTCMSYYHIMDGSDDFEKNETEDRAKALLGLLLTSVDTVSDTSESIKHPGTGFRIKSELCEDRSKLSRAVKRATKAQVWRPKQAFHC